MTAPILKLRATKTPMGFPLLSIGEWLIETVDMRASDVGDALGAIGGDAGLAQMVAIAPQLGLTVARLTAERDDALSLLIEEQQARHAAGTRVAQLEGLLREAQQWVVEEPGVTMAGAAEALDDRITAALDTAPDALAKVGTFDGVPVYVDPALPYEGPVMVTRAHLKRDLSPDHKPSVAQLCEVDAVLKAGRTPVYVRTRADLDVVRACLVQRDHEVIDLGTALMCMGVFFGCADASMVVPHG